MEKTENIAELFYTKLKTTDNPGQVLSQFYGVLFSKQVGKSEIISINRLIKIFGKYSVFMSLIDISRKETFDEFPFGLIFKICRDRLELNIDGEITSASSENLHKRITEMEKEMLKVKAVNPGKVITKLLEREEDDLND